MSRVNRRLAAIVAADVVGFSAKIERDEEGTLRSLNGHFSAFDPIIGAHSGRIVKTMGDGFLAEFGSVVDAVSCAAEMQKRMLERNVNEPEELQLLFRMGVHVGDIVVDGDDILGDGVNIAARLESIAKPGGVSVSGRVYEDVENKTDLDFIDTGFHELKNISRPVQVFDISLDTQISLPVPPQQPDKPSVAVLPFTNMSSDAEQEYFADGLSEDLITALSYIPWIFVIARNSSFTYKGLAIDVRKIGIELGVQYILEGSIRRAGDRLRVTGQLIEAETGNHIWADRYEGTIEDIFDLQDKITGEVVAAIAPKIRNVEIEHASRKHPDNLTAYDYYLQAISALNNLQIEQAATLLEQAISTSPDYAKAKAVRAWCYTLYGWHGSIPKEEQQQAAIKLANAALASPNIDPETSAYAGYTIAFMSDEIDRGISFVEDAVRQCPSFAWGLASLALLEYYFRSPERAIELGKTALRLSPRDPQNFRSEMAISGAYLRLGQVEECLEYAEKALQKNSNIHYFLWNRITCFVELDRRDDAQAMANKFMSRYPEFCISNWRKLFTSIIKMAPDARIRIESAMHIVGIPD